MFEFKFPDVGEGITEGVLVKWLVKVGQSVKKESPVAEIETDKAVVEIPSPVNGVVSKLLYKEHDTVFVGKTMIIFDGDIATEEIKISQIFKESQSQQSTQQINNIKSVSYGSSNYLAMPAVKEYAKKLGVDLSQVSPSGGMGNITLEDLESFAKSGKNVIREAGSQANAQAYSQVQPTSVIQSQIQTSMQSSQTFTTASTNPLGVLATPSVRQLARELGVDITKVVGTGDIGKITAEDVKSAKQNLQAPIKAVSQNVSNVANVSNDESCKYKVSSSSNESESGPFETVKISGVRKVISRKMTESKNTAVHFTISDEADVTEIVQMRDKDKAALEARGIKLTYLAFFVKAAVLALERSPKLNSTYNESTEEITYKKFYNIGIAVDTEAGLMVPVIKNCEKKTIVEIAKSIADLASKARERKIKIDEMTGGTFTITSVGSVAGQFFTQIINQPESAILGIGRIIDKPVVKNGTVVVRKMLTVCVTADHRTIDGADAARFLQILIGYLENPDTMMLEMI